jgi:hypothetical protein
MIWVRVLGDYWMANKILLITGGTSNYSAHINVLLSSIRFTNPEITIMVGCFGWSYDLIESFREVHKAKFIDIKCNDNLKNDVRENRRSGDALKMKTQFIFDSFQSKNCGGLLWIDADSVVTKSLYGIISSIESKKYDVFCTHRSHRKHSHDKFATGVLGFSDTKLAKEFLTKFNHKTNLASGLESWFHDQIEFYNTFNEIKPCLYPLNNNEHTIRGDKSAIIYSRREVLEVTPFGLAKIKNIPIKLINNIPNSIYPI